MNSAYAIPTLQLGIGGGFYDLATETIVTSSTSFTLYAYAKATGNKAIDLNEDHFISIALSPQIGPVEVPFGSFTFAGSSYDISSPDVIFGNPPLEDDPDRDPGDLAEHGQFPTFYVEHSFKFSGLTTEQVNTQDSPSHTPTSMSGGSLYFAEFEVDVANLLAGFGLHFDLYNTKRKNGDLDIKNFAPFSHDAATTLQVTPVSEPSTQVLLLLGLLGLIKTSHRQAALKLQA